MGELHDRIGRRRGGRSSPLVLLLAATVFGLVLGEALLQVAYRLRSGGWIWQESAFRVGFTRPVDDRRGYALRPGYDSPAESVRIDQRGFRAAVASPLPQAPTVVCIGDSVVFGSGVAAEQVFCAQLEARMRRQGRAINVLNAGVPSYNLLQTFEHLKLAVEEVVDRPAAVIVHAANDVSLLTWYGDDWTPQRTWAERRFAKSWRPDHPLRHLATRHYLTTLLRSRRAQAGAENAARPYPRAAMLAHVRSLLAEELSRLGDRRVPVAVLAVNPFHYQLSNQDLNSSLRLWPKHHRHVEAWNGLIAELNQTLDQATTGFRHATFLDPRSAMDRLDRNDLYLDFIHYSPEGHRLVADQIGGWLAGIGAGRGE